jgi:hypothetical protein
MEASGNVDLRFRGAIHSESRISYQRSQEYAMAQVWAAKDDTPDTYGMAASGAGSATTSIRYKVDARPTSEFTTDYVPLMVDWYLRSYTSFSSLHHENYQSDIRTFASVSIGGGNQSFYHSISHPWNVNHPGAREVIASGTETFDIGSSGLHIVLAANASIRTNSYADVITTSNAVAYADPRVYIDPTWEYADLFELDFSLEEIPDDGIFSNLGVSSTGAPSFDAGQIDLPDDTVNVNEPSAFALFGLGLAGLFFSRRKSMA